MRVVQILFTSIVLGYANFSHSMHFPSNKQKAHYIVTSLPTAHIDDKIEKKSDDYVQSKENIRFYIDEFKTKELPPLVEAILGYCDKKIQTIGKQNTSAVNKHLDYIASVIKTHHEYNTTTIQRLSQEYKKLSDNCLEMSTLDHHIGQIKIDNREHTNVITQQTQELNELKEKLMWYHTIAMRTGIILMSTGVLYGCYYFYIH